MTALPKIKLQDQTAIGTCSPITSVVYTICTRRKGKIVLLRDGGLYGVRSPSSVPCFYRVNLVCLLITMRDGWLKEQEYTVDIVHDLVPRTLVW